MDLDFSPVWEGWHDLLRGALVTVEITACALALGCVLGLMVGIGRLNPKRRWLYGICTAYVAAIRGTPLLVQLFILFFGLPHFGILLPAFVCGVLGLGVYSGAYVSEIVRGAIQSIDKGQTMAAQSLGMTPGLAMRHIVLPQAVVRMIPPLGNEFIGMVKATSLASVIQYPELLHNAENIYYANSRVIELLIVAGCWYLLVVSILTPLQMLLERHFARGTARINR